MSTRIDMTGKRVGRLLVLGLAPKEDWRSTQAHWQCLCDCGVVCVVQGTYLRRRESTSCGCFAADYASVRMHRLWKNKRGAMMSRWEKSA